MLHSKLWNDPMVNQCLYFNDADHITACEICSGYDGAVVIQRCSKNCLLHLSGHGSMSNEFKDRLARGQLTNTEDYQRMKDALHEMKKNDPSEDTGKDPKDSQEWKNWDLSPVWSPSDAVSDKAVDESISADSVHRAIDRLNKN